MRIIINDSSALIDLAKTRLLECLLRLPYRFVIPDVLYADELITLHHYRRNRSYNRIWCTGGLKEGGVPC